MRAALPLGLSALLGTSANAQAPPEGSGASRWGEIPAAADSVQAELPGTDMQVWEKALVYPYRVLVFPLSLAGDGMIAGLGLMDEHGTFAWISEVFGADQGVRRIALSAWAGLYLGVGFGGTINADQALAKGRKLRISVGATTQENYRFAIGAALPREGRGEIQLGAGTRVRNNARFYGLGPESPFNRQSFYAQQMGWLGASSSGALAANSRIETSLVWDTVEARATEPDESPALQEEFAAELPYGYGRHSDGFTIGLRFQQDTSRGVGRPENGGSRQVAIGYFVPSDGWGPHLITLRIELQQFLPLWHDRRALALRAVASWIEADEKVPFSRLLSNDDPDLLRGSTDLRWRDRGLLIFSAEYRWPLWVMRKPEDTGLDLYAFSDTGQVFGSFSGIDPDLLSTSNGFGIRLVGDNSFEGRLEIARAWKSEEGWLIRLRADQVFQFAKHGLHMGREPIPFR